MDISNCYVCKYKFIMQTLDSFNANTMLQIVIIILPTFIQKNAVKSGKKNLPVIHILSCT